MKAMPCDPCYETRHNDCRDGDDVGGEGWCCCGHLRGWRLPDKEPA